MAKYTKTPIDFFLKLSIGEFYKWVEAVNEEIELESKEMKKAQKK
ncbi:hypothetical protein [Anaerovibrio sp.]|nr:hypothetical protein [Anaerovibrio sp.]